MNELIADCRYALRNFAKKPALTLLIVITLGLGIGANTAIFSMVYNVLLAPLPFSDSEQLVMLQQHQPLAERRNVAFSAPTLKDFRQQSETLSDVFEYHTMQFTLLGEGDATRVQTGVVNWDHFDILGIKPIHGRSFLQGEDERGSEALIILSNHFWHSKFGADPDVVGRTLQMNNAVHTVIGVLPEMPAFPDDNDIYVTVSSCPFRISDDMNDNTRAMAMMQVFGKMKPEVTMAETIPKWKPLHNDCRLSFLTVILQTGVIRLNQ